VALVYAHDKAHLETISPATKGVIRRLIREIQDVLRYASQEMMPCHEAPASVPRLETRVTRSSVA
jgi:hypothetical protein